MAHTTHEHLRTSRLQWWCVIASGALTLIFGSIGMWQYERAHGAGESSSLTAIYHAFQMLVLHTPHFDKHANGWMQAGQWLGAFTFLATALILLWKRFQHEWGLLRLVLWRDHYVVCGLGQKGMEIVDCLKANDRSARVVVIDKHPESHLLEACLKQGVPLLEGDAASETLLRRARVSHAREAVVITPEDETNVRIAVGIRNLSVKEHTQRPECYVHLENIHLRERLQALPQISAAERTGCALKFFDVYDSEARKVLLQLPLDGQGIGPDDPRTVHLIIVGFGRMGRSLATRAAKMGHFANRKLLRISVIDRHAMQQQQHFLFRYPMLEKKEICDLQFHEAEAQSLSARRLIERWAAEPDTLLHIFVCLDDNARGLEVGLRLQESLIRRPDCNLFLRIKTQKSLAGILEFSGSPGPGIVPFGMLEDTCCDKVFRHDDNENIARLAHEEFVQSRLADSNRTPQTDPAMRAWDDLTEDLRESSRQQVDHVGIKLRSLGLETATQSDPREARTKFSVAEVELLAEMEHSRWNAERWLAGWRYGTPSDKSRRINENLGPWDSLHDSIKDYDRETVRAIPRRLANRRPPQKVVKGRSS